MGICLLMERYAQTDITTVMPAVDKAPKFTMAPCIEHQGVYLYPCLGMNWKNTFEHENI